MASNPVPSRPERKKRPIFKSITAELDDEIAQKGPSAWKGDPTRWKDAERNKVGALDMTKDPGNNTGRDGNTEGDGGNSTNAGGSKVDTREEGTQAGVDV